jgi:hypothetical protein
MDPLLVIAIAFLTLAALGFLRPRGWPRRLRIPAVVVGIVLVVSVILPSPPSTPESALANPVPVTVDSVAVGTQLYAANCATCHGVHARGNGPQANTTSVRPPALTGPESHRHRGPGTGNHADVIASIPSWVSPRALSFMESSTPKHLDMRPDRAMMLKSHVSINAGIRRVVNSITDIHRHLVERDQLPSITHRRALPVGVLFRAIATNRPGNCGPKGQFAMLGGSTF